MLEPLVAPAEAALKHHTDASAAAASSKATAEAQHAAQAAAARDAEIRRLQAEQAAKEAAEAQQAARDAELARSQQAARERAEAAAAAAAAEAEAAEKQALLDASRQAKEEFESKLGESRKQRKHAAESLKRLVESRSSVGRSPALTGRTGSLAPRGSPTFSSTHASDMGHLAPLSGGTAMTGSGVVLHPGAVVPLASMDQHKEALASVASASTVAVVECFSPSCGPCVAFAGKYREFARNNQHMVFLSIDTSAVPAAKEALGVMAVPTFILYARDTEVRRVTGANAAALQEALQEAAEQLAEMDLQDAINISTAAEPASAEAVMAPSSTTAAASSAGTSTTVQAVSPPPVMSPELTRPESFIQGVAVDDGTLNTALRQLQSCCSPSEFKLAIKALLLYARAAMGTDTDKHVVNGSNVQFRARIGRWGNTGVAVMQAIGFVYNAAANTYIAQQPGARERAQQVLPILEDMQPGKAAVSGSASTTAATPNFLEAELLAAVKASLGQ